MSLVEDIRKVFGMFAPVGGWPDEWDDWTEEEQAAYYDAHSPLNIEPPKMTQEQIEEALDKMQQTADQIAAYLRDNIAPYMEQEIIPAAQEFVNRVKPFVDCLRESGDIIETKD